MHCHHNLCGLLWWQSFVFSQKACHSRVNKTEGIKREESEVAKVRKGIAGGPSVVLHLRTEREV